MSVCPRLASMMRPRRSTATQVRTSRGVTVRIVSVYRMSGCSCRSVVGTNRKRSVALTVYAACSGVVSNAGVCTSSSTALSPVSARRSKRCGSTTFFCCSL